MLRKDHLPQLIPNRVHAAVQRMHEKIWASKTPLAIESSVARPEQCSLAEGKELARSPVSPCSYWGKLFDQRWSKAVLPEPADDNTWLIWRDQGEATLYVNDVPYFGFNVAHRYCRLPAAAQELWVQSTCVQSAIWHPEANGMTSEGSFFEGAWVARRDEAFWQGYHDLKCLFDLMMDQRTRENPQAPAEVIGAGLQPTIEKYSPSLRILLRGMDEAVDALDREGPAALSACLSALYAELKADKTFAHCVLTGHAHVDLVWIWPERVGELKAVNVFATTNRLMEEYPEYRFAYSQPASYEAVARREPGLYSQVKERMASKAWEATGAMYVESDTMMATGEALARSFVVGQACFEDMNGRPARLTWLPDVFGYAACLPLIMKQTGVEYFFTTKMTWNAINRFPHSSFIWRGHDGSEILAHVTQESGYVTHMEINNIKAPMHANQQADIYPEYLLPTGYGDGGGGPTDEMLERARRLGSLPGMPSMGWDQPEAFFDRLSGVRDQLPIHKGECYLEYHRGTFTTHGNLKASFRGLERALQTAEAVAAATGKRWEMETAWKRLIFSQFHDYIPGSSVWDVYLEGLPELDRIAREQLDAAREHLAGEGEACIFNPHAHTLQTWVKCPESGEAVYVELPPLSGTALAEARSVAPAAVKVEGHMVSNGQTTFSLDENGWVSELTLDGVETPLSGPLGQLMLYPDRAAFFESWDIDRHVLSMGECCDAQAVIESVEQGPRAGLSVTRKVGKASTATVTFTLERGSPLVHVDVELDWHESECLLKLLFPTEYSATNARFGIPYGSVLRPQVSSGMTAEAMWEVPFNRYLAVFDEGEREGMFLVSEAKYGASVHEGTVGVSLVRSPRVTGNEAHAFAWPPHLSRLEIKSIYSDQGKHSIRLAMGRYAIDLPRAQQPAALADTLFTPPIPYRGKPIAPVVESIEGGSSLVPCWAKPCADGAWMLRLHEVAGRRGQIALTTADGWQVTRTDIGEQAHEAASGPIRFKPYEVVSLKLSPAS